MGKKSLLIHVKWGDPSMPIKQQCDRIKSDIDRIEGITESFFTKNSDVSDIAVLAEWESHEIEDKISEIRRITNVKSVKYHILVPA